MRTCDDPIYELEQVVAGLECLTRNLQIVSRAFQQLADETRKAPPSKDATDEEYRMWEDHPHYELTESKMEGGTEAA